jgi:hypothetical protein
MVPSALSSMAFVVYVIIAAALVVSSRYVVETQLASLADAPAFGAKEIVSLVNTARTNHGLPQLVTNIKLSQAASAKLDDMFTKQYFAHFSPENRSPWDFFRAQEYRYLAAGENLAMNFASAQDAHVAFMQSATHRANILHSAFTEIGVAVRQGEYEKRPTIFIAEYFGRPRGTPPVTLSAPRAEDAVGVTRYAALTSVLLTVVDELSFAAKARLIALLTAAIAALAFLLLIARTRSVPRPVAARAVLLAVLFTAVVTVGIADVRAPRLTPNAASVFADTAGVVE